MGLSSYIFAQKFAHSPKVYDLPKKSVDCSKICILPKEYSMPKKFVNYPKFCRLPNSLLITQKFANCPKSFPNAQSPNVCQLSKSLHKAQMFFFNSPKFVFEQKINLPKSLPIAQKLLITQKLESVLKDL